MDLRIGIVRKHWSQRKRAFGRSSVVIVDANGNSLLDIPAVEEDTVNEEIDSFRETNDIVKGQPVEEREREKTEKCGSKNSNRVDKDDLTVISGFLESKKHQIFTAKLNKSNYICFLNGKGMLICRGKFNISEKSEKIGDTTCKDERIWKNKHFDTLLDRFVPLLVACKVSGLLIVVTGDSNETDSMVDIVKEITGVLADI